MSCQSAPEQKLIVKVYTQCPAVQFISAHQCCLSVL
ncbi:unnamed protein product, partial [Staurois parvus]